MDLAIFKVNFLGDSVVFLPVVQTLRRRHPDLRLIVWTDPATAPLYAADVPAPDLVLVSRDEFFNAWRQPWRLVRHWASVRRQPFAASLLSPDQGNVAHLLARLAGGPVRAGAGGVPRHVNSLTHAVDRLHEWNMGQWDWEIARKLLGALGWNDWPGVPPPPDLRHLCTGGDRGENRVTIHAGSKWDYTRWPLERYVGLAGRLARDHEVIWIDRPETHVPALPRGVTARQTGSLAELVSLLNSSRLFVGNNSGPMHLASALGTPSVILSGPTHPAWDPHWNRERMLVLRQAGLSCQPCDGLPSPAYACRLAAEPLACLRRWEVAAVEACCRDWLRRHACGEPCPARP